MAGFKSYEEMKKADLIGLCELHNIEVHTRDTKQDLIDKLNEAVNAAGAAVTQDAEGETSAKKSTSRAARGRRRQSASEREAAARKQEVRTMTEEVMDDFADKPIADLRPRVVKRSQKIHTVEPGDAAVNEAYERIDRELAASLVDPYHVLKGVVIGPKNTETREVPGVGKISFVNYMVAYGPYTILIPSFKFWYDWNDLNEHPVERLYEMGSAMEGAEIEFNMFKKFPGVSTEIFGTRLYATKIRRCEKWYAKSDDGGWDIEEGSIVKAKIMRVRPYDIVIEYAGAEARIPIGEVSHFYIDRIKREDYWPGKEIIVRVSNIVREEVPRNTARFDYPVKYGASIKAAQKNPQIVYFDNYDKHDTLPGIVTNIKKYEDSGKQLYYVNIRDQVVAAADLGPGVGKNYVPEIGSRVKIRIVDKNRENHTFYGLIVNVEQKRRDKEEFAVLDL